MPQLHELYYRFMGDIICLVRVYAFVTELPNYQTKCRMLMVRSNVKYVIFLQNGMEFGAPVVDIG